MRAGTYGIALALDTGIDLTGATDLRLTIQRRSDKNTLTRTMSASNITGDPKLGKITYTVVADDFPTEDVYRLQVSDVTAGRLHPSEVVSIYVGPTL